MEYRRSPHDEQIRERRRRKQKLRTTVIFVQFIFILILAVSLIVVCAKYNNLKNETDKFNDSSVTSGYTDSNENNGMTEEQLLMVAETEKWYMMLVNPDNSVTKEFIDSVELKTITEAYRGTKESAKYLDKRVIEHYEAMCKAASDDGIALWACSAYRDYEYQQGLFNNRVTRFKNNGLSEADAKTEAAKVVAIPGTSEHHLGLAVDIISVEESFENTKEFRWLQENAADYGFIMRYPKDKQDITKIIYEPWHYRYVGVEHAKAINELGMCLEEYIEYLKRGGIK